MAVVFESMQLICVRDDRDLLSEEHLHSTVDFSKISVRNHLRWLEADTNLESSWAPINELDGALCLEGSNSGVDIFSDNVTTVQQAGSHVLSVTRVTLNHLVVWLEAGHGDLLDGVGFVGCLGSGYNWGVCDQREMDTWVWNQIRLKFIKIDVKGTVKSEGSGNGRYNLSRISNTSNKTLDSTYLEQ
jgi:hypothetical protein